MVSSPLINFRAPVLFEESALRELCCLTRRGYETKFKKETFGFLFGTITQDKRLIVRPATIGEGKKAAPVSYSKNGQIFKEFSFDAKNFPAGSG